jgi:predicted DCC family thiol-disulfide oxidoreductase YuxK
MHTRSPVCVPLTVYYDRSCPLCAAEMHELRDLDWRGRLDLVDCSAPEFSDPHVADAGLTREQVMTRLHVRDPQGRWLVGLDAFEAVYAAANLDRAARFWGNLRLRPLLDPLYGWVARNRQALSRLGLPSAVAALLRRAGRGRWRRE